MLFKQIPGIKQAKIDLIKQVKEGFVAHAQLFFGKEGSANLALALALARYLHCEDRQGEDSCGLCRSCRKYDKYIHPDLHFVFPVVSTKKVSSKPTSKDFLAEWRKALLENPYLSLPNWLEQIEAENKQGNISVEESRQVIQALSLKAFEGSFKIMIMWLPEMMNVQAANAILKILEEPPAKTIFLLASQAKDRLLSTIISRVQIRQIPDFRDEEISRHLENQMNISDKLSKEIAYLADGNLNLAYTLAKNPNQDLHVFFRDWMRACYKRDIQMLLEHTDLFSKADKTFQKQLMQYGIKAYREALLHLQGGNHLLRVSEDKIRFVQGLASTLDLKKIEKLYQELTQAWYHIERNANTKITFLDMSLKFSQIFRK